ncbi:c-type cytochrome [Sabulicella rubraurantiaca]|uniref:c-type cytochrome n=1 Tax=Sabulicella rubraurantiaca TaxID=2811429 RepID=UPI001A96BB5A|nr:c-type cytochrome [Sabulicella rubraurantiaca]
MRALALLVLLAHPAMAQEGAALFRRHCASCHDVTPGAPLGAGPNLAGLAARGVAGDARFDYSPTLRAGREAGRRWDAASLASFLADPDEAFPGTWMSPAGPATAPQRDAIARFLLGEGG